MRISLLVPIIDQLIVNKFTDIPLWYICISFSPTDPGYTGYACCINSSGFLGGDAWDYYPHDNSYGIILSERSRDQLCK